MLVYSTRPNNSTTPVVWKYPSMQKIATLTGHTYRVLYLAVSALHRITTITAHHLSLIHSFTIALA